MPDSLVLIVRGNRCNFGERIMRCAHGKNGFTHAKQEGDLKTPIGRFLLRECWYRPDRVESFATDLTIRNITKNDGWCDDVHHAEYNRHVSLPFAASHETLWREDEAYNIIIPLGYNDGPIEKGKGSAIFLHLQRDNYHPTEGCIALSLTDMRSILPMLSPETIIDIAE
jgi:L,D-peptidoglycan transpeptidase YkuD (ErfK/YbiS/YcfS/YnhG family)